MWNSPDTFDSRLELLDRLRTLERRATISRFVSVIAHLIGTPLQVIAGRAALIRTSPEMAAENARRIEEQVDRLASRIHKLIGYLTTPEPEVEPRALADLMAEALSLYGPIARYSGIVLDYSGQPPPVMLDGNSTMVVLISLLSLAIRLGAKDDRVVLELEIITGRAVVFALPLRNFPVPSSPIDRLDPPDGGDLAHAEYLQVLSVCHGIATKNGGRLDVSKRDETTSTVRFECPFRC